MTVLLPRAHWSNWRIPTSTGVVLVHLAACLAPFFLTWQGVVAYLVMYYVTGCVGITFGYHRLLSHKSFKANPLVRYFTALCGSLALQGGPIWWCAHHRLHHRESDKEMDPHSPKESFWWSHVLWFQFDHPMLKNLKELCSYVPDLADEPVLMFIERYFVWINIAFGAAIWAISNQIWGEHVAWSVLIWGGFLRTVGVWHATWFVNSATHRWGYKRYESGDDSLNNWWVALITWGEGWHNNHHAKQRVARSGHAWYEIDITYWHIAVLKALGMVWDVVPIPATIDRSVLPKEGVAAGAASLPKSQASATARLKQKTSVS